MYGDDDWDYETPVEEIPGYVGLIFDDFIEFSNGLLPLIGFDFQLYGQMADERDVLERQLEIDFGGGPTTINFGAYSINEIVASIPSINAIYDCPPDQGPGGGSGYIFLLDDGCTLAEANASALILRSALDADFRSLETDCDEVEGSNDKGK